MYWEAVGENCIVAFLPELEPLFAAQALIDGEEYHHLCTEIYGAGLIADWKRRYRFLFETYGAVKKLTPSGLLDFLLDAVAPDLTRARLREGILALCAAERLERQSNWEYAFGVSREELVAALTDDGALAALYEKAEGACGNYLAFSAFVRQNERYIRELFALADEMDTPALHDALAKRTAQIEALRERTARGLERTDPLSCAQELMGKTFYNRGPYESFYFLASLLLPWSAMRLFYRNGTAHNRQVLVLSVGQPERSRERNMARLKALADPTRYQILALLAKDGPINGQDVAKTLGLAPSTVSHHMNALREAGLVTEEQVKTAKYYGVARDTLRRLSEEIKSDLKLE